MLLDLYMLLSSLAFSYCVISAVPLVLDASSRWVIVDQSLLDDGGADITTVRRL